MSISVVRYGSDRMRNVVATGFDVSTKDNVGKGSFGDVSDTDCYGLIRVSHGLIRNDTCQGVCTADEERYAAVQVRVSTNKNGLIRISTNRHGATRTWYDKRSVNTRVRVLSYFGPTIKY